MRPFLGRPLAVLVMAAVAASCRASDVSGPTLRDTSPPFSIDTLCVVHTATALAAADLPSFQGANLLDPRLERVRPLVALILADYGNPRRDLDKARALRDWVARMAVHPFPALHVTGSSANIAVLPEGKAWVDVNRMGSDRVRADSKYWSERASGFEMLDSLVGQRDSVSGHWSGGILEQVAGARFRIRDLDTYRTVLCSYQVTMLRTLWLAIGLRSLSLSTVDHDPAALYLPAFGGWIYMDPTFNEDFVQVGSSTPVSPLTLFQVSLAGETATVAPSGEIRPVWDGEVYASPASHAQATYFGRNPGGMLVLAASLNSYDPERDAMWVQLASDFSSSYYPFDHVDWYPVVDEDTMFPVLGAGVSAVHWDADSVWLDVFSTQPQFRNLMRRIDGGPRTMRWAGTDAIALSALRAGARIRYESFDVVERQGASAEIVVGGCEQGGQVWTAGPA